VIDRGAIAGGITSRTTAHLAPLCDDLMSEMIKLRGLKVSKMFYQSQAAAIDRIEQIQKQEGIDCDFRRVDGYLFQAPETDSRMIDDELEAVRSVGAPVHRIVGVPLRGCEGRHALRYPKQATFHPLKYLKGLAEKILKEKGRIFGETTALKISERDNQVAVKTDRGTVTASACVVATNSPVSNLFSLHTKMAPYRSYALSFSIKGDVIPDALYWDTEDPYHYVRINPDKDGSFHLVVGGADHKTGEADDALKRFDDLEEWIRKLIPYLGNRTHQWSGQLLDTIDYAAYIGRNPGSERIYVHTGDSGQGITHGVAGAMLNTSLILGHESAWKEVYDPGRISPKAALNYVKENTTALKNFAEYIAPGELSDVTELTPGSGAIVRSGLKKIAAFRDDEGQLHMHSAACTHLGCHLHFNSFEKSWDCPCHGSQFAVDGVPLNAPAVEPLSSVDVQNSNPSTKRRPSALSSGS